jgi:hypothetical protein
VVAQARPSLLDRTWYRARRDGRRLGELGDDRIQSIVDSVREPMNSRRAGEFNFIGRSSFRAKY